MKLNKFKIVLITVALSSLLAFCSSPSKTVNPEIYTDKIDAQHNIHMHGVAGKGHNHPTFVIWQENSEGQIIKTLFITKSYATGIFGHENIGDTAWNNKPGKSTQPAALPYWTYKKGLIDGKVLVPTPDHPYVDAFSGATPKADFSINSIIEKIDNTRILMEVNQPWDWNDFWTNDKYPQSESYKHSAQPSVVYAVNLNYDDTVYYLNPIGHGDPRGLTGKLYTDLSTLTSAKDIFKQLKITLKN